MYFLINSLGRRTSPPVKTHCTETNKGLRQTTPGSYPVWTGRLAFTIHLSRKKFFRLTNGVCAECSEQTQLGDSFVWRTEHVAVDAVTQNLAQVQLLSCFRPELGQLFVVRVVHRREARTEPCDECDARVWLTNRKVSTNEEHSPHKNSAWLINDVL